MSTLWVIPEELDHEYAISPHALDACKMASQVLWSFSGRRYLGIRTVTETYESPCMTESDFEIRPYMQDGAVYNTIYSAQRSYMCGCPTGSASRNTRLRLRGTPVRAVHEVKQYGQIVDPSKYSIINSTVLQLKDSTYNICGLEVTYTYGSQIPSAGRLAARKLATELIAAWSGESCNLPDRVTSVSRQGVSLTVLDPQNFLDDGRTGIYEVDLFLRSVNPTKALKKAKVFSPDVPKSVRVTSGAGLKVWGAMDLSFARIQSSDPVSLPSPYDLDLYRGDTRRFVFRLRHSDAAGNPGGYINLTGYEVAAQVRTKDRYSPFVDVLEVSILNQSTLPGGVEIYIPAGATDDYPAFAYWDLQITAPDGEIQTLIAGQVRTTGQVTV